jgi:hypothetical protein
MNDRATDKNIIALADGYNRLYKEHEDLKEKVKRLEANVAFLTADIANTKQMTAHIAGRGMGSTKV